MIRKVRVSIDKVVVDGPAPADRAGFERALREHLARGLEGTGAERLASATSRTHVDGGRLARPTDPAALGRRIVSRLTGDGT